MINFRILGVAYIRARQKRALKRTNLGAKVQRIFEIKKFYVQNYAKFSKNREKCRSASYYLRTMFTQGSYRVYTYILRIFTYKYVQTTCSLRRMYVRWEGNVRAMNVRWTDDGSAMRGRCDEKPLWSHCGQRMLRNVTPCYAKNAIHRSKKQESVYLFRKIAYVAASEALQALQTLHIFE